jgi:hypothetical protein
MAERIPIFAFSRIVSRLKRRRSPLSVTLGFEMPVVVAL